APGDVLPGQRHLVKFFEHLAPGSGVDSPEVCDLKGELFDLFVCEVLKDLTRYLGTQADHENRGFLPAGECRQLGGHFASRSLCIVRSSGHSSMSHALTS